MKLDLSEQTLYEGKISDYWDNLNSQTKRAWGNIALQVAKYKEAKSILVRINKGHLVSTIEKDYLQELVESIRKSLRVIMVLPMGIPIYLILNYIFKNYLRNKLATT